jgi:acetamidase/formamidase
MNVKSTKRDINRRDFIKYTGAVGAALAMSKVPIFGTGEAKADIRRLDSTGKVHILACRPGITSTGGYWDNSMEPVMRMKSGEIVHIETKNHLFGGVVPGTSLEEWEKLYRKHKEETKDVCFYPDAYTGVEKASNKANHTHLTGPIYIEEAEPGDILQIEILDIVPESYAFNVTTPNRFAKIGLLADEFPEGAMRHYYVDLKNQCFDFKEGIRVPINPFPGTIGVELPEKGRWSNIPPGKHAGNMDNPDLVVGTVLYTPVWIKGAGLKTGDSHIAQTSEANVSALEGCFRNITLRVTVRKDLKKLIGKWPFASTPTHWMTMGMHTSLWESCRMATRHAIDFLNKFYGMDRLEAYAYVSIAAPLRITQLVDHTLGVHCMIPKDHFIGGQYKGNNELLIPKQA